MFQSPTADANFAPLVLWGLGTLAICIMLDRLLLRAERKGWINYRRRGLSRSGAAFHSLTLQSIFQPSAQSLIEAKYTQVAEEDDSGDPPGPGDDAHASMQALEAETPDHRTARNAKGLTP